jgi:hypothetical protein
VDYRTLTTIALRLTGVAVLVKTVPYAVPAFLSLFRNGASSRREALLLTAFAMAIPLLQDFGGLVSAVLQIVVGAVLSRWILRIPDTRSKNVS